MTRGGSAGAAHDHVCFAYDDDAVLAAQGRGFLADGAAEGCEVWWIGDSPPSDGLLTRVVRVGSAYPTGAVVDPAAQVRAYAAATDAALAAGF
ncbi:hypothetical protein AB0M20_31330, partial [Actinoplanes sp. NPDC051633]|uniref:hypothetical protein n=1 Tax=Actinoplanes sp. NPDC051633 TaxID=3155670 RepID=UPI00341BC613